MNLNIETRLVYLIEELSSFKTKHTDLDSKYMAERLTKSLETYAENFDKEFMCLDSKTLRKVVKKLQ